jgi:hypothetical protein
MSAWHRRGRVALLTTALVFLGALPAKRWAEGRPAPEGGKQPRYVLIIRHAEKPKDGKDVNLTSRGAGRAAALPSLFLIPPTFPTKPARFPTPDFLFATKDSKSSDRPVETVQPLSKALGDLHIHDKHSDKDYQAVVDHVFGDAKYAGKTVLICWHHGKIPDLALSVSKKAKNKDKLKSEIPQKWSGKVFDRLWQFTFDSQGNATFADQPQRLLFGDSAQ